MILLESVNTSVYDIIRILPFWMIFVIILLILLTPFTLEIIRFKRKNDEDKKFKEFTSKVGESVLENQKFLFSFKDYLEGLYGKLDVLLDLLYERHANNLNLDIAVKIIEIVYERAFYKILSSLSDCFLKKVDGVDFSVKCFEKELDGVIKNRYFSDVMVLNKMTCKGISLDLHLLSVDPSNITKDIIIYIETIQDKDGWEMYKLTRRFLENYSTTLINKAQSKLEDQVKAKM